jgi:DinB superfamily
MLTSPQRQHLIEKFRALPGQVAQLTAGLTAEQLTTPYLSGEWTVAQNIHHLPDSHMNSYIRCKLMATEDTPPLKPYDQDLWAAFPDAQIADISGSLALLRNLHARWVTFWEQLPEAAWSRTGVHQNDGVVTLEDMLRLYAAHGEGHIDQITRTLAAQP